MTELEAYIDAMDRTVPDALTACRGWTAHDVTAHLAAAAAEVSRHLAAYIDDRPIPRTQTFEEREPPFRALPPAALRDHLVAEESAMRGAISVVLQRDPDAVIPWTGRRMVVAKFLPHLRNEFAIHRWDLLGDDRLTDAQLADPALTEHTVTVLGHILSGGPDPLPGNDLRVPLRSPGQPDVVLTVRGGAAGLALSDGVPGPAIDCDPAARVLLLWGRRPDRRDRIRSHLDHVTLGRVESLLGGY